MHALVAYGCNVQERIKLIVDDVLDFCDLVVSDLFVLTMLMELMHSLKKNILCHVNFSFKN